MNPSLPACFYQRALAAVGQAVIATDSDRRVLYWNAAAEQLYGYEAAQAVARPLAELIAPVHARDAGAVLWASVRTGESFAGDCEVRDKGGRIFTVYAMSTPILDGSGTLAAMLVISYDVTERRLAEARGRHLAAIVENSDDLIIETDPHGATHTANSAVKAVIGPEAESADWLALSNDLRDALARDELSLHYQPVIELATGRVRGVEALARWHHANRGPVSPAKFVTMAEATGLAAVLNRWALDRVRRDVGELRRAVPGMYVAVNVSAAHLGDPELEKAVLSALRIGHLSADELVLEVTESAMMDNLDQARAILERLKVHGVRSAIDDFGTGYSSLGYLSRLPASTVKIDRSFIENITEDKDALAITSSVIRLARRMRLTTVAEGVETEEQLTLLRQLGCTAVQGYLFSPAVSPAHLPEVVEHLAGWNFGAELIG